jgi:glycosyltransferase involved in cell wall biosynthesis
VPLPIDVTVIVAVYNPGRYIDECVESLLNQSLPSDRYEVIFVDDGSTDETPALLDDLAARHSNVMVRHEPASGWSGRPRNVALGLARGDYVFICDHDDWLGPEALERMVGYARRTGADVVAPKVVGHARGSPTIVFERNLEAADVANSPVMSGLAPHKLFRRQFLLDHDLRFQEGRRFEDQVFVASAYLLASRISVLADYPCYHHVLREDQVNAAFQPIDAAAYRRNVAEVLDVLERYTEPGPRREMVKRRPFQQEILSRFSQRWFANTPEADQRALLTELSGLVNERYDAEYGEQFGLVNRTRAAAIRRNDFDELRALADRAAHLRCRATLRRVRWEGDAWVAAVEVDLGYDDSPLLLTAVGPDSWSPDPRLLVDGVMTRADTTEELLTARATIEVVGRSSHVNWFAPHDLRPRLKPVGPESGDHRLTLRGTARFDPATLAGGSPLEPDVWDVRVRMYAFGTHIVGRLRPVDDDARPIRRRDADGSSPVAARPVLRGSDRHLAFRVGPPS